jgi:hypothetical protein
MHADSANVPDVKKLFREMATTRILTLLARGALWRVGHSADGAMLYEPASGLLWQATPDRTTKMTLSAAINAVEGMTLGGLKEWRVPTLQELRGLSQCADAPILSTGTFARLSPHGVWLCTTGTLDTTVGRLSEVGLYQGWLVAVNDFVGEVPGEAMISLCLERGWSLAPVGADADLDLLDLLRNISARAMFADLDYMAARLPKLDEPFFNDPACGLWELWGLDQQSLSDFGVRARNPADDVLDWDVAIDFGTSGTVVAYNEHGRRKLLRVGMDRFWEAEEPENYANPTALEFVNLERILEVWRATAYRPAVSWDDVRCSHAALAKLDDPDTMHALVASVLTGLKQWALRDERDARIHIRDTRGYEHAFAPTTARNPVLGIALNVGKDDPFDPIELYAWFLGMNINWRGRGIFLRYYMSFPVAYPEYVRDRILASFRRGLQRSLPAALIDQPAFAAFRVEELASEPAAYAAAALPALGIEPTVEGVAYAVFDFGGGTTDFEFGKYRLPLIDEDEELEEVLEHWGAAGDPFLGGEHLLENMAYMVFQHNIGLCTEFGITFARPQNAADFAGHEMYVANSRIAATNTAVLAAALRPLWERGPANQTPSASLRLIDRSGKAVDCSFEIPVDELDSYLAQRIGDGIQSFFLAMRKAFGDTAGSVVNVLLAGNACRSPIVDDFFFSEQGSDRFQQTADLFADAFGGEAVPEIVVHRAPPGNGTQPAMAKTGVALGLLRLCPGGAVETKHAVQGTTNREAPFAFFVGRIRRGIFQPVLQQAQPYGVWADLGSPRDRVLKLSYTRSALALAGDMAEGDEALLQCRIEFADGTDGRRVFTRAIGPHEVEICIAGSVDEAGNGDTQLQRVSLG